MKILRTGVLLRFVMGWVASWSVFPARIQAAQVGSSAAPEAATPAEPSAPSSLPLVLSPGPYYIGGVISATLVVPDVTERPQIDLGSIRDFEVRIFDAAPLPESAAQKGFVFRLNLLPKQAGMLNVPALPVGGMARRQLTVPLAIEVAEPQPAADMSLTATLSESTCYVGQPITLEVVWTLGADVANVQAVDLRAGLLEHPDYKSRDFAALPKDYGTAIGLPVSHGRVIGGVVGSVIRFRKIIVPQKAGTYSTPGAAVLCSVTSAPTQKRSGLGPGFQYAPQYDNQFFSDAQSVNAPRLYARSAPLKIRVLALPEAGRPADFSGIIGAFSLAATVEPSTVRLGEPLTLTLRARDFAYPEVLELPPFSRLPGFRGRFRIPPDRGAPTLEETADGPQKSFRQSLRPISTGVDKVPAIAISFFDPVTASYGFAHTPEIPLRVLPHAIATGFDAILSDGSRLKNILVSRQPAIGPNFSSRDLLRAPLASWTDTAGFWWVTLVLPPLVCGAVIGVTRRRRCRRLSPALEQAVWAYPDFLHDTRSVGDPRILTRAVQAYLRRRLGVDVITFGAIEARLRTQGVSEIDLQRLRDLFAEEDRRNFAAYGRGDAGAGPSPDAVRALVASLEAAFNSRGSGSRIFRAFRSIVSAVLFCLAAPILKAALPTEVRAEAESFFQAGLAQQFDDPDAARDAFRKSAAGFEYLLSLAEAGLDRGKLHYNTGAARFFAGELGAAVYHFKMAQRLLPADQRVRSALAFVRSQQSDATPETAGRRFLNSVRAARDSLNADTRRLLFATVYVLSWLLMGVAAFRPSRILRRSILAPVALTLLLAISLAADRLGTRAGREGVVLESEMVARKGPAAIYESAFETPVHAGAEFRIVGRSNDWLEIVINGAAEPCWIPASAARVLGP